MRHPEKLQPREGLTAKRRDINDEAGLVTLLAGHDTVISAVRFQSANPRSLIGAVKRAGLKRLLVVGARAALRSRRACSSWTRLTSLRRTNRSRLPVVTS